VVVDEAALAAEPGEAHGSPHAEPVQAEVELGPHSTREGRMPRKDFRPEEITAKLREADVLFGQGKRMAEVVRALGFSEVTYHDELCSTGGSSSRCARPRS
jgi:hypothetical protein